MRYDLLETEEERKAFRDAGNFYFLLKQDPSYSASELRGEELHWTIEDFCGYEIDWNDKCCKGYDEPFSDVVDSYLFDNETEAELYLCEMKLSDAEWKIKEIKQQIEYLQRDKQRLEEKLKKQKEKTANA